MTSIIKVDNLQNQCGANIISESANVITIGASGDTVTLAAGASQSGFGRSGSVNWDTTPKTATPVTAVSGNGYFINTTSIAITVNLPSTPAAGDIVAIADYANTSATNNITVGRNGSNIDGEAIDAKIKINGQVYTLVYVDATEGWKTVGQTFNQISTATFVAATGGTVTCCGNYKIHTFTGPGTFTVTSAGNPQGSTTVDYLVVAGGASGGKGANHGGGGGAGGYRESVPSPAAWTASPLANPGGALPVSVQGYPITVGGGGAAVCSPGTNGNPGNSSIFSTITSAGGGGAGRYPANPGLSGGSGGGGGGGDGGAPGTGGTGNTPPTSPPQGSNGGNGTCGSLMAGGGGATAVGQNAPGPAAGGAGATSSINGTPTARAGGGGGGGSSTAGPGGSGGGGAGQAGGGPVTAGTANTGGGGGGQGTGPTSAAGGSGIVIVRYKFQ